MTVKFHSSGVSISLSNICKILRGLNIELRPSNCNPRALTSHRAPNRKCFKTKRLNSVDTLSSILNVCAFCPATDENINMQSSPKLILNVERDKLCRGDASYEDGGVCSYLVKGYVTSPRVSVKAETGCNILRDFPPTFSSRPVRVSESGPRTLQATLHNTSLFTPPGNTINTINNITI